MTRPADGAGPTRAVGDPLAVRDRFDLFGLLLVAYEGPAHRVVACNAAFRDFVRRADPVGAAVRELVPEFEGQQLLSMLDRVYATGERQVGREWRVQTEQQGALVEYFIDFVVEPVRDSSGAVVGLNGFGNDVTAAVRERRASEERSAEWERRFTSSQAAMATLQGALLPAEVPVLPGLQVAARYLLSEADTAAGGDWFDVVPRPDGRVALVVGDVVGHGIAASAVMARLRSVLEERLAAGASIPDALAAVDAVADRIPGAAAATVCVALHDPRSGTVEYCTAGHPPPLLVGSDGWRYLETTGAGPLGSGTGAGTATAQVGDGELLLLYSDGLIERPGRPVAESTVELGQVAFRALTDRGLAGATAHAADRVCEQSLELLSRNGYADDITVLAARRIGRPAPLTARLPAGQDAPWNAAIVLQRWLAALDAGPDDQASLRHAVVELVSNVVEHAYRQQPPGPVVLLADLAEDGHATIVVTDEGRWREADDVVRETAANGDPRLRGLGLALVREVVDEFGIDHGDDGTTARLRRRLRRPAPLLTEAPGAVGRAAGPDPDDELEITGTGADQLAVRGPLHLGTVPALDGRLAMETRGGTRGLTLDLSGLTHLASAGVQLLQEARRTARDHGQRLILLASPGTVASHVLDLVALDHDAPDRTAPDDPRWS